MNEQLNHTQVLHVEDNRVDLIKIQSILNASEISDYHFVTANTAANAVAILEDNAIAVDIILLDLGLPDSIGLETLESITRVSAGKPIIITTHADDHALAPQTITLGAQDYITKDRINKNNLSRIIKYAIDRNKSELALQKAQAYAQAIVDTAAEAIISIDSEGIIESFNHAAEEIFGYSSDEITGQNINILMPSPYKEEHDGYLKHYAVTGQKKIIGSVREVTAVRKNGEVFPAHLSIGEVYLNHKRGFTGIIRDISEQQRIEQKLKASQERLELATEVAKIGIWDWYIETNELVWNSEMHKLFATKPETFTNDHAGFLVCLHPHDRDRVNQAIEKSLKDKTPYDEEYRVIWLDQSVHYISSKGQIFYNQDGKAHRMTGTCQDITQAKAAELALIKSEERFKLAINGSNDGIWDWPDTSQDKQYWSSRFKELLSYQDNEISASMSQFKELVHPDDRGILEQALQSHWQYGQKFQLELRLKTKSQQYHWFSVTANTVLDRENQTNRMTGSIRDIQERKEYENSLKKLHACILDTNDTHEKKLENILALAQEYLKLPFGIVSHVNNDTYKVLHAISPNGEIEVGACFDISNTYCAYMLSMEKDDVMTLHCAGESDIAKHPCYRDFQLETYIGIPLYVNEVLFGTVNFSANEPRNKPFNEEEKSYIRMIAQYIGYEISYQQHLKTLQSLDSARKLEAIGQMAAGIAHEINTPTQYVGDHVEFLQTAFDDMQDLLQKYKQGLETLNTIDDKAELLNDINDFADEIDLEFLAEEIPTAFDNSLDGVNKISEIVKAMKGFGHPGNESKEPVNLNQALENTITVCRNEWKYVADVKTELQIDLPLVECFPGELNQVFLNLIVNAAHAIEGKNENAAEDKGIITVQSRIVDDNVEVNIQDTGTGIPETARDRIFDPFYTTKAVGKGTGQGLAIAHSIIVDKHQGKLDFTTEEGVGTTFHIRLPIEADQSLRQAV